MIRRLCSRPVLALALALFAPVLAAQPAQPTAPHDPPPVDEAALVERLVEMAQPREGERAIVLYDPTYYPGITTRLRDALAARGVNTYALVEETPAMLAAYAGDEAAQLRREQQVVDTLRPVFEAADIFYWMPLREYAGDMRWERLVAETVPRTAAEMAELARLATPLYAPGEGSQYSSAGYSVLARVCELAGGRSYGELLEEHVFAPLGMSHSAHADSRMLLPGRASSYVLSTDGPLNSPLKDLSFLVGAGSVWSTAHDLYRMQRGVLRGELGANVQYSLQAAGLDWNGLTNGYRAFADYHAQDELHVIFVSNMHTGAADLFRQALPRLARGEELPPAEVPSVAVIDVDPAVHSACQGLYRSGPNRDDLVLEVAGDLVLAGERVLWPTGANTFFSPADFGTVTVNKDDKGVPGKLDWVGPGFSLAWQWAGPLPALR